MLVRLQKQSLRVRPARILIAVFVSAMALFLLRHPVKAQTPITRIMTTEGVLSVQPGWVTTVSIVKAYI